MASTNSAPSSTFVDNDMALFKSYGKGPYDGQLLDATASITAKIKAIDEKVGILHDINY